MEFIRNSEVKRQIVVSSILTLFWCGISIIVDSKAVWIVLSAIISSSAVSLFFTYQRYKKIADLSLYIDRLLHGDETISFEQLQAADVSFPDAVRNVAVVNNMPAYKVGDSHDVISMELKGDGKTAAEALAEEIANANYFEQVIICDSALRGQDTELREDVMLTQDEVQKLAADLGVDLIFSFDRLDIHTKRGALFIDTFDGGFSVDAVDGIVAPVIRIYIPSRERPMLSFSKQDTISWEIEPTLSDKKIVKEASEYAATMPVNYLLPHWREVSRFYFDGGNVRMRDAGVYVRENNWDSAFELWKQIYDKGKGRQKMRAAFNIGLYYEMKDNPATAIEWVEKADKLAKAGTTEATVIAFYLLKLKERQVQLPQLNIQMNRFKDNF